MENLPLPLFSSIVGFAVHDFSAEIIPDKRIFFFSDALKNVALVSKSWHNSVRELIAQCQLSTLTLTFDTANRSELLEMRATVLTRGRQVTDLRISMGQVRAFEGHFSRPPKTLDTLELGLNALIAHMPGLRRLDLSEMPLCSPHTVKVVEAATKFCRGLEALILPGKEDPEMRPGAEVDPLLVAVYKGLERWRGLRQLRVPTINEVARYQSCKKFFDKVVELCPQVEYLDGYKQSLREMERLTYQDTWLLNLEDWRKFNAACTNIREFNWIVAPIADPYFKVFGEYVKPQLTKLAFCVSMLWDWRRYFFELNNEAGALARTNIVDIGRAMFARNASTALLGCPGLLELEMALYYPPEDLDDPFDDNFDPHYFPDQQEVENSIFGDQFWETLATNCPHVKSIVLWEVVEELESQHIHAFTDRGLIALAQLKYLDSMELRAINCSGNGLFEFLNGFSDEFSGQRTFQIWVGGKPFVPEEIYERTDVDFYDAIMSLLTRLADTHTSDLRMSQQRIVLRLKNAVADDDVSNEWSIDYLEHLKRLVARVKETHLSLRLRITTRGYNGDSFRSIMELGLYAAHAKPSPWFGWDEQESNRGVVFVNRENVRYTP
ncbi:hypothetical protein PR003_g18493 [Phytophthora rubi]|uniref:Uncharacterized protein n=1 Tax=Phytophthora rubi TaxID=129364 RepID=A0A6A4E6T7_9STRA|nr:hypothetical protein PR002_g18117 [Phytophthora rubi]KAE9002317.1 hypothetical protein PR001_g18283 [Phytophthora rubi]KAE9317367.1 hypothetical protein PR003_g18493 [Phytophthora rubi]